jgi:hypothetical protein
LPPDNIQVERFSPLAALPGDTIHVIGVGFDPEPLKNVVQFNGSKKSSTVISSNEQGTELQVVVADDAQAGSVKVASGPYSALSVLPFLLSPSIGSVNPEGGLPGDQITVSGRNFTTNLSGLLIFMGDYRIDSIFGGSSTQIIFPLPAGLPAGITTVRVGTRLTATDSVMSPPVPFTVFDSRTPTISSLEPNQGVPGAQFVIKGNAFDPTAGKTVVLLDNLQITNFIAITPSQITLSIPSDYPIAGLGQKKIEVKVVVNTESGQLESNSLSFTIVEPSNIEFYYMAYNEPEFSGSQDDSVYQAIPLPGGGLLRSRLFKNSLGMGLEVTDEGSKLYSAFGGGILVCDLINTGNLQLLPGELLPEGDLALDETNNHIFYDERDGGLKRFNINNNAILSLIDGTLSPCLKATATHLYYITESGGNYAIRRMQKNGSSDEEVVSGTPEAGLRWVAMALHSDGTLLIAESPMDGLSLTASPVGSSRILAWNGTNLTTLYTLTGKTITDVELSKNGNTLYWMVAEETGGGIESGPLTPGAIKMVIGGIRNGRYFDVVEK